MRRCIPFLMVLGLAFGSVYAQSSTKICVQTSMGYAQAPAKVKVKSYQVKHRKHDRLQLQLGGGVNYAYGLLNQRPDALSLSKASLQGQAFLGYRFDRNSCKGDNLVGLWGTLGNHSQDNLNSLLTSQELPFSSESGAGTNNWREVEIGLMLREKVRVSVGQGSVDFQDETGSDQQVRFQTATIGYYKKARGNWQWNINATTRFGKDFNRFSLQPSIGAAYYFDFLRM
ncbi:MAG: hypothetical protein AAFR61_30880 [Bacteroidota bacterium]